MLLGANSEFKLRLNSVGIYLRVGPASPVLGGLWGYVDLAAPCLQGSGCFLCVHAGFPAASFVPRGETAIDVPDFMAPSCSTHKEQVSATVPRSGMSISLGSFRNPSLQGRPGIHPRWKMVSGWAEGTHEGWREASRRQP